MKRLIGLGIAGMFLFIGCISFQIGDTEKELVAKIAARHVGFEINKKYPDIAIKVKTLSENVLIAEEGNLAAGIVDSIISVLTDEAIDNLILQADIEDLTNLIEIQTDIEITEEQMTIIRAVAKGLIEGINLGGNHEKI